MAVPLRRPRKHQAKLDASRRVGQRFAVSSPQSSSRAVSAGRGLLFITGAKLWFMVAGYVVVFALPRALGSPASYGIWVLVLSVLSSVNMSRLTMSR